MANPTLFTRQNPIVGVRAVHLDLKGCPPTPERLLALLKVFAACRYNAVLVEWEDMFPWTLDPRFRCETAYSPDEVRQFCGEARRLDIELIPLVQCLGHMETPLGIDDYRPLRELPDEPGGLNPLAPGARELVEQMVDDVLRLMPGVRRFHLGGDEAWTFGQHPDTKAFIAEQGAGALYLHYVGPIMQRLASRGIRPLLWHDMMIHWSPEALRALAPRADLVVWGYRGHPDQSTHHFSTANIQRLHDHGLTLWGAGAYKGADGHSADLPDLAARQENALAWAELSAKFHFLGLIATAWSRYSTHMVQNEPIDAALDSLLLLGVIFHDGQAPAGGGEACEAELESIGQRERFIACRAAMRKLADLRRAGWGIVRDLREQRVMARLDARRRAGGRAEIKLTDRLSRILLEAETVMSDTRRAFAGFMSELWIDRYLAERIEPLKEEAALLGAEFISPGEKGS